MRELYEIFMAAGRWEASSRRITPKRSAPFFSNHVWLSWCETLRLLVNEWHKRISRWQVDTLTSDLPITDHRQVGLPIGCIRFSLIRLNAESLAQELRKVCKMQHLQVRSGETVDDRATTHIKRCFPHINTKINLLLSSLLFTYHGMASSVVSWKRMGKFLGSTVFSWLRPGRHWSNNHGAASVGIWSET